MKSILKIGLTTLILVTLFYSCKQGESPTEESAFSNADQKSASSPTVSITESTIPVRKFIRTADIKFKVKNVEKATYAIENATTKYGGFLSTTNLQSTILEKMETKISNDSILETTQYAVKNNLTLRVPNAKLDTVLSTISKQVDFLDFRVLKADDVSIQLLANQMAQNRSYKKEKRIEKAIDTKGNKLKTIVEAEDKLGNEVEQNDSKKIENLSLLDQVNYSTVNIEIYQRDAFKQEVIKNEKNKEFYRPNLGIQIMDSLTNGWHFLETILIFIIQLWGFILMTIIGYLVYRKYLKK